MATTQHPTPICSSLTETTNFYYINKRIEQLKAEREEARDRYIELINTHLKFFDDQAGWNEKRDDNKDEVKESSWLAGLKKVINEGITVNHKIDQESITKSAETVTEKVKDEVKKTFSDYLPSADALKKFTTPMAVFAFILASIQWYRQGSMTKELFLGAIVLLLPEAYSHVKPYIIKVWRALTISCDKDKEEIKVVEERQSKLEGFRDQMFEGFDVSAYNFKICPSTIKLLTGGMAGIILGWIVKDASSVANFLERAIKMKDFPNLANGIYGIFEWFISSLESIINWIRHMFGKDKWFFWTSDYPEAEQAIREGYDIVSKYNLVEKLSLDDIKRIIRFDKKLEQLEITLPKRASREITLVMNLRRAMVPLMSRVKRCNVEGASSRVSPFSILFCGESAIGKSSAQIAFAKAISARLLPEERLELFLKDCSQEIYSKNEQDGYWEGYKGHFITWHDDICALKSVAGQPSAESGMIPEKNEIPYNLNMAFQDKGKNFFTSDVILGTSNFIKFCPENLAYPQAFINRWDMCFVASVKKDSKFCANPYETNPMKRRLKKELPDIIEWYSHLTFYTFYVREFHDAQKGDSKHSSPNLNDYLGEEYNLDELIDLFVEKFRKHRERSVKLLKHHDEIISVHLAKRREEKKDANVVEVESDSTPVPGNFEDQNGDLEDADFYSRFSSERKNLLAKLDEKDEKQRDQLERNLDRFIDAHRFAAGMIKYGSHAADYQKWYLVKKKEANSDQYVREKFEHYKKEAHIIRSKYDYSSAYAPALLAYMCDEEMNFHADYCPLMSMDKKLVVDVKSIKPLLSYNHQYNFYKSYYTTLRLPANQLVSILEKTPLEVLENYPSLQNPDFVSFCDQHNMFEDEENISVLASTLAAIQRLSMRESRCLLYRAKKTFKEKYYDIMNVSYDNLKKFLSLDWLKSFMNDYFLPTAKIIAALVAGGYMWKYVAKYTNLFPIFTESELKEIEERGKDIDAKKKMKHQSNSQLSMRSVIEGKSKIKDPLMRKMVNQAFYDVNLHDANVSAIIEKVIRNNVYFIFVNNCKIGTMLFVNGYYAIMPKHFVRMIDNSKEKGLITEENPVRVEPWSAKLTKEGNPVGGFSFVPKEQSYIYPTGRLKNFDIVFFNSRGTGAPPKTDVVKFFISANDFDVEEDYKGSLFKLRGFREKIVENVNMTISDEVHTPSGKPNEYAWLYMGNTKGGDCGAVIGIHNVNSGNRKIGGIHTQGRDSDGYGSGPIIFKEWLQDELRRIGDDFIDQFDLLNLNFEDESGEILQNQLWKEESLPMPKQNSISKSPLHSKLSKIEKIPVKVVSFKNNEGIEKDPIIHAVTKKGYKNTFIDNDVVQVITNTYFKFIKKRSPIETYGPGRIFTVEEACEGIKGDPYLKSIPRSTSAGHPENIIASKKGGGKYLWFGKEDDFNFSNEYFRKLKAQIIDIIRTSNNGVRNIFIFYWFPKMETIDVDDVMNKWKLRMVCGSPMSLSIASRMLSMECTKYLVQNRIVNCLAVGMDVHGKEWDRLGKKFENTYIVPGDLSGFEWTNHPLLLQIATILYNLYYNDDFSKAREMLDLEALNSRIAFCGGVYEKTKGLGSGTWDTLIRNSLALLGLIILCAIKIHFGRTLDIDKEQLIEYINWFLVNNAIILQGDDFMLGLCGDLKGKITFGSLKKAMAVFGYELTLPDNKTGVMLNDYVALDEVTFLKRKFVLEDGRYIGPLDRKSIDNMIQWVSKKRYKAQDFEQVMECFLCEYSLHGEKLWEVKYKALTHSCRKVGLKYHPRFSTHGDYKRFVLDGGDIVSKNQRVNWDSISTYYEEGFKFPVEETPRLEELTLQAKHDILESFDLDFEDQAWRGLSQYFPLISNEEVVKYFCMSYDLDGFVHAKDSLKEWKFGPSIVRESKLYRKLLSIKEKEERNSGSLSLSQVANGVAINSLDQVPKPVKPKDLFKDQTVNMTSTTANTPELKEETHGLSESIKKQTTEFISSVEDNFVVDNTSLEAKLRRVVVKQNDIRDFLAKKQEIGSFTWATTNVIGDQLTLIDIDFTLQSNAIWTNKTSGFLNFRGTAVLTLQVTANPFQQGIMRVVWKPYVGNDADWAAFDRLHSVNPVEISQLPGVYHQVSTDTVQMRAPIIGPLNSKRLDGTAPQWNYGFFSIYVYAPLNSAAADSVLVRMFLSFEDVEMDTPFYNQAGNPETKEKKEKGIVSGTAGALIPVVQQLGRIPMLSNITGPSEWILKAIQGGAESLGWAKPNVSDTMSRVTGNIMYYATNHNGADASVKAAHDSTNAVTPLARASLYAPQDEMSIAFIKTREAYFSNINWSTTNNIGDNLITIEHRPSAFTQQSSLTTSGSPITIYHMTPVCYLANLFQNWRGDLEIKFMFSKTGFHAGTLSFTYVPGFASSSLSYLNNSYNLRHVVDIQTCEEFCMTLPYSVPDPYTDYLTQAGFLKIDVVTPLKAPSTVANNIDIVILVKGKDNLDFQVPRAHTPKVILYDQGGDITNNGCVEGEEGNTGDPPTEIAFSSLCVGEAILSLKQLITPLTWLRINTLDTDWTTFKYISIPPLINPVTYYFKAAGIYALSPNCPYLSDKISTIANCYLFMRGGMNVSLSTNTTTVYGAINDQVPSNTRPFIGATPASAIGQQTANSYQDRVFVNNPQECSLIMKQPYYNRYPVTLVRPMYVHTQSWSSRFGPPQAIEFSSLATLTLTDGSCALQRSMSDDFQLSFWLGVPPLYIP